MRFDYGFSAPSGTENVLRGSAMPRRSERLSVLLKVFGPPGERLEAAQREADDARGRGPEWERTSKGGQPYRARL